MTKAQQKQIDKAVAAILGQANPSDLPKVYTQVHASGDVNVGVSGITRNGFLKRPENWLKLEPVVKALFKECRDALNKKS